jgi:hypothetical protein
LLTVLVVDLGLLAPAWGGGQLSPREEAAIRRMAEAEQTPELRALGNRAVPVLAGLYLEDLSACILGWQEHKKTLDKLTPEACKQALLDMMRSRCGRALGFFDKDLVDKMEKVEVKKVKDEYHWTGAYRFDPAGKNIYVLFVSLTDKRPPLEPHRKGYLLHLSVYEGSFEVQDGRVIATVPTYKYTLLD